MRSYTTFRHVSRGILGICLVLSMVCGCSADEDEDVERRRQCTISQLEEHAPGDSALPRLKAANSQTLRHPELLFVRCIDHSQTVFMSWMEAFPTVTALDLFSEASGVAIVLPLSKTDQASNDSELRKGSVLFYGTWSAAEDMSSDDWARLREAARKGDLRGRLVKNGVGSGMPVQVEFRARTKK